MTWWQNRNGGGLDLNKLKLMIKVTPANEDYSFFPALFPLLRILFIFSSSAYFQRKGWGLGFVYLNLQMDNS